MWVRAEEGSRSGWRAHKHEGNPNFVGVALHVVWRAERPIALQADGEYLGETEAVKFQFVPHALRIVA